MITVGGPSGGGAGSNLWKFHAAPAVTNIDLNTAAGVAGMLADLPSDPNLHKVLSDVFGFQLSGEAYNDNVNISAFQAIVKAAGVLPRVINSYTDFGPGEEYRMNIDPIAGEVQIGIENLIFRAVHEYAQFTGELRKIVENKSNGDQYVRDTQPNGETTQMQKGGSLISLIQSRECDRVTSIINDGGTGGQSYLIQTGGSEMRVGTFTFPGLNAEIKMFNGILRMLGQLQTDQIQAPAAHPTKSKEIPIYDAAGVLQGYIPVMT